MIAGIDLFGGWLLTGNNGAAEKLLYLFLLNAIASAILAAAGLGLRPANRRGHWRRDYLALLGIGLLIPLLGPILMLLGLLLLNLLSHRRDPTEAQQIVTSPFVPEHPRALLNFGVGGTIQGLTSGLFDTDKSIRVLMVVEQKRSAHTSQVLFDTLGHPDESVRLTAAGLLDRRESRLLQLIQRVEKAIAGVGSYEVERVATLHLEAAQLNAEMLYLRLAREGMAKLYVDRWSHHLDLAESVCFHKPDWLISKARWLQQCKLPGSTALYQRAFEAGAAPASVMPYLAERRWESRDYDQLRKLADAGDLFAALPVAGIIRRRWGHPA
ncbi:MAG: hypothetical protein EPN74_04550 [Rhodanobacter sp.]|nr:MAG: hypothetical protein EPN74_04550 [Rhodanobacter sp.]